MINIAKEQKGTALVVRMTGSIEENVNLDQLIGVPAPQMIINCKGVSRINSVGVKGWIKYFQGAQAKGTQLIFQECSPAIVEQMNLISNFTCGGTVESIFVPFVSEGDGGELLGLFKVEDLKKMNFQVPPLKCPRTGKPAVFDDIPEEYFGFLMR